MHNGGGNPFDLSASLFTHADDPVALAAARVLGADVLAPWAFLGMPVSQGDLALAGGAARAFPPDTSSVPSTWTHWGLTAVLHRLRPGGAPAAVEPEAAWAADGTWQQITHRFAQLASLASPMATALLPAATARADDLSRGFVRAVRRQDWVQAAAVGRWLAAAGCAPESLGLTAGLAMVAQVGADDARAALHVRAAQALARGER
ncbi:hypothetical protein ACIBK8_08290 [Streptomyces sp. NPDC050161]|uniref:hypothetical protein n=1 Tax=Streptomyces sp. NPDC050161 TaxID=3365604 RepID=UPI0037A6B8F9